MNYLLLAEGFEEVEAVTVVDMLRRAEIPVTTVAVNAYGADPRVTGSHGLSVVADRGMTESVPEDLSGLILPGGSPGADNLGRAPHVQSWIRTAFERGRLIAAVCAAPGILGDMGLLKGKTATCFGGMEDRLKGALVSNAPACRDGNLITGRSAGCAILFGAEIVRFYQGDEAARALLQALQCPES